MTMMVFTIVFFLFKAISSNALVCSSHGSCKESVMGGQFKCRFTFTSLQGVVLTSSSCQCLQYDWWYVHVGAKCWD